MYDYLIETWGRFIVAGALQKGPEVIQRDSPVELSQGALDDVLQFGTVERSRIG
jgi:hypothetical protein